MNGHGDAENCSNGVSRRRVLAASATIGAGLLAGCSGTGDGDESGQSGSSDDGDSDEEMDSKDGSGGTDGGSIDDEAGESGESMDEESGDSGESTGAEPAWRTTELTDVLTDETFTVDELDGPVAIQSFAVWCPKCERQSEELSNVDESVTVVSLNTDPNEDAEKVRQHAENNGFDWRFAVSPTAMTESLVEEFGTAVTNAPSTPIIVACGEGVAEFFSGSQQSAETVQSAAAEC